MNINTWMSDARDRDRNIWSKRVESFYLYPKVRTQEKMQNIRQLNLELFLTNNINIKAQALYVGERVIIIIYYYYFASKGLQHQRKYLIILWYVCKTY